MSLYTNEKETVTLNLDWNQLFVRKKAFNEEVILTLSIFRRFFLCHFHSYVLIRVFWRQKNEELITVGCINTGNISGCLDLHILSCFLALKMSRRFLFCVSFDDIILYSPAVRFASQACRQNVVTSMFYIKYDSWAARKKSKCVPKERYEIKIAGGDRSVTAS